MTLFWIVAVLLAAYALAFLLPPLVARERVIEGGARDATNVAVLRDELSALDSDLATGMLSPEQYGQARREIERRVLDDVGAPKTGAYVSKSQRAAPIALAIAVPLIALLLYGVVGTPGALAPESAPDRTPGVTSQQIESMVARLAARLESNPEDTNGWVMLGRSYAGLGRFSDSAAAYANAVKRLPPDAQLLADYAESVAMAQNQRFEGEPARIIALALEADPKNLKALALAGTAAFEKQDFNSAVTHWQKLLEAAPANSYLTASVRKIIAEAKARSASALDETAPRRKQ
jgi:cytochrome c-type biogenesis protein CcmH